jgi:hypothetical protein
MTTKAKNSITFVITHHRVNKSLSHLIFSIVILFSVLSLRFDGNEQQVQVVLLSPEIHPNHRRKLSVAVSSASMERSVFAFD